MSGRFVELEMGVKVPLERVLTHDQIAPRSSPSLPGVRIGQQRPDRIGQCLRVTLPH
jgi:hypothetical protein